MILTRKAAEYAENYETLDRKVRQEFPELKLSELTEDDQIFLFQITMMFERDEALKFFTKACLILFIQKALESREALLELISKMKEL